MNQNLVTGRTFLPQEEIYYHMKKFTGPGRNVLLLKEITITERIILLQEEISQYRNHFFKKKLPDTGRRISISKGTNLISQNVAFLSLVDNSCCKKVFTVKK